jgi:hypothetical protein
VKDVPPHIVSIYIAVFTVIVMPIVWWIVRKIDQHRREAKARELEKTLDLKLKGYVTTTELASIDRRLEAIQMDGREREGRIIGTITAVGQQAATESQRLGNEIKHANQRIDSVLGILGNRRK